MPRNQRALSGWPSQIVEPKRRHVGPVACRHSPPWCSARRKDRGQNRAARGHSASDGQLDITLYRDDSRRLGSSGCNKTEIPADVTDSTIVVVDDVLLHRPHCSRRDGRAVDFGRPRRVELEVLIDRGHRELPIQADYVGKDVQTTDIRDRQVMLKDLRRRRTSHCCGE